MMTEKAHDEQPDRFRSCVYAGCTLRTTADGSVEQLASGVWTPREPDEDDRFGSGYLRIQLLGRDAAPYWLTVHKLVLLCWVGAAPEGRPWARHRDGQRRVNHVGNLYWGTCAENNRDQWRLREREYAPVKLDEQAVYHILSARSRNELRALTDEFGVRPQTLRDMFDRRTWRHVRLDQPRLF